MQQDVPNNAITLYRRPVLKRSRQAMMGANSNSLIGSMDIIENTDNICISVDLPGVAPDKVEVSVLNGCLNVKAERSKPTLIDDFGSVVERAYGLCQRSISIPTGADENSADCKFENGVLTVSFTKKTCGRKLIVNCCPNATTGSSLVKVNGAACSTPSCSQTCTK